VAHFGPVCGPGVSGLAGAAFAVRICEGGNSFFAAAAGPVGGPPLVVVRFEAVAGFDDALDFADRVDLDAALDLEEDAVDEGAPPASDSEVPPSPPAGDVPGGVAGVLDCPVLGGRLLGCRVLGCRALEGSVAGACTFAVTVTTSASVPLPQPVSNTAVSAISAAHRMARPLVVRLLTVALRAEPGTITDPS